MPDPAKYDVFLSHSSHDKAVARDIANRLKADGLKVWFDEWLIPPGGHIQSLVDEGLEQSQRLVLCMSKHAFGSDWASLEAGTFRFRDPLSKDLRFIPLRLDDEPIKASLAPFLYIDWRTEPHDTEYQKLLAACRTLEPRLPPVILPTKQRPAEMTLRQDDHNQVLAYALSPDGRTVLTLGEDGRLRLWDLETSTCLKAFDPT